MKPFCTKGCPARWGNDCLGKLLFEGIKNGKTPLNSMIRCKWPEEVAKAIRKRNEEDGRTACQSNFCE